MTQITRQNDPNSPVKMTTITGQSAPEWHVISCGATVKITAERVTQTSEGHGETSAKTRSSDSETLEQSDTQTRHEQTYTGNNLTDTRRREWPGTANFCS